MLGFHGAPSCIQDWEGKKDWIPDTSTTCLPNSEAQATPAPLNTHACMHASACASAHAHTTTHHQRQISKEYMLVAYSQMLELWSPLCMEGKVEPEPTGAVSQTQRGPVCANVSVGFMSITPCPALLIRIKRGTHYLSLPVWLALAWWDWISRSSVMGF